MREKNAVVIDVELERTSAGQEGGRQEVEAGEQKFALVELGSGEETAAIIQHVEHGEGKFGVREPAVGRGVELPEFAGLRALPAAHGSADAFGRDGMGEFVCDGPAADLGAVELEGVQPEGFGSGEAIWTRGRASQALFEEVDDGLGPRGGMVPARSAGRPVGALLSGARRVVNGGQSVEATGRPGERPSCAAAWAALSVCSRKRSSTWRMKEGA